ncbi:uncharacterized protein LOC116952244 isoform X2 [Petromyzon marinus]|uniref:Troponin C, skeletal muscle-like isoform X2 n=1 Tax=Petromyzon marinus TaxID=7757 RepID=A0AAJ7U019_PETMA|nr:troponin C, skeletal muscle-like isoform X2 [Petromyzon marinus]
MNGHRSSSRKGKVETAVSSLIEVFHRYAGEDGDDLSLSVTELRSLIRHELPTMSQHCQSQQAMDNLMRSLDANGDGTIDFSEYMTFLNKFTILIDDFYIRSLLRNQAISLKASTAIEEALYGLVEAFHKHAGSSGDPFKLNKQEFKNLLQTEMPTLHECLKTKRQLKDFISALDQNGDGEVDFGEFMSLVGRFARALNHTVSKSPSSHRTSL